ncbi:metalloendopeptidase [Coemansia sp. RSA 455]|nr:metalloendopeptidase [Coemansia sp. RSA 455]
MELAFCHFGLALDKDKCEHLGKIKMRIAELATKFSCNINEGDGQTVFTHDKLEGLPSDFFEGHATEVVHGQEGFVVTTKYPEIIPEHKHNINDEEVKQYFPI